MRGEAATTQVKVCRLPPGASAVRAHAVRREQRLGREHLAEERFGSIQIPVCGKQEVDQCAMLIDGPVEVIEHWRREYNEDRPYSALGNLTPRIVATQAKHQRPHGVEARIDRADAEGLARRSD